MNESSNFYQLTEKLIQDLSKLGVKDATLERRQSYFRSISTYMKQRDIVVYTPQVGAEYLAYKKSKLVFKSYQCEVANIHQLNEVYNNIPVTLYHTYRQRRTAPQEYAEIFLNYKKKLEADGLKQTTIECQMSEIALFCINLKNSGILDIHDVTPQLLIKVASMSDSQNYCPTVRRFLRYLAKNAILDRDLSAYLPKSKSCVILPSVYSKTELDAIESTFDCDTAIGKRNHAMFLLSSRLGFRTSDVRACLASIQHEA